MRIFGRLVLAAAVLLGSFAGIQAMAADAQIAVAVVRIQEVFRRSDYAKQMEKQIKDGLVQEEKELDDLQKMLKSEQEKLQSNALLDPNTLSYKEMVMKFQLLNLKFEDKRQNYQKTSRQKMATFWRSVYAEFQIAIKQVGSTGKYLVIETTPDIELSEDSARSTAPELVMTEILQRRVQYTDPTVDITELVIQVMNQNNQRRGTR